MKYKLLIVDDELANLRLLERLFARDFECLTASSGAEAIQLLEQHDIAILVTDQRMPQMTGIDLLRHTARLRPHMVRILLTGYTDVEVLVEAVNSGLVYMYVTKPWNNEDLKLKINRASEHYESNKKSSRLALVNDRLTARIHVIKLAIIASLAEMLKARDGYAYHHAVRVRDCATAIALKIGLSDRDTEELAAAAMVHDLGEVDIFSNSTLAPGLAANFSSFTQAHSECEAKLLAKITELGSVMDLVKFSRENFDGTGSPGGLAADQIPLTSRILRVADEYDLMTQPKRPAAAMKHDEVMRFLSQRSGKQFDPGVIEILSQFSDDDFARQSPTDEDSPRRHSSNSYESAFIDATFS
jgi:response regulator RpfG family c-di-GMP phosphodiesterase